MHWLHKKKKKDTIVAQYEHSSSPVSTCGTRCPYTEKLPFHVDQVGWKTHTDHHCHEHHQQFQCHCTGIFPYFYNHLCTWKEWKKKKKKKAWEFSEVLPVPASPSFGTRPKHIPEQWSSRTCALTHNTLWNELQHSGVLWWNLLRLLSLAKQTSCEGSHSGHSSTNWTIQKHNYHGTDTRKMLVPKNNADLGPLHGI